MLNRKAMISFGMCAAALIASTPGFAQERSVSVAVSDLDLSGPSGQAQLEKRIMRAARSVCTSGTRSARSASNHSVSKQCEAQAIANAEPKIANRIAQHKSQRGIAIRADLKMASE